MVDSWGEVRDGVARLVAGLDPAVLHAGDAARVLERVVEVEKLCAAARVLLAPRAAEAEVWKAAGGGVGGGVVGSHVGDVGGRRPAHPGHR